MPVAVSLKEILKRKEIPGAIIALFCSFLLFPCFFESLIFPIPNSGMPWLSLDPSWKITLNKINREHLNWGEDFILTYGPLSYLSTRVGWGVNKFCFLMFDLFTWFNFFYIFYKSYKISENKFITILLIFSTTLLFPLYAGSGVSFILLAFLLFWIRQSINDPRPFFYTMQIALCILLFFIKFNTGLIALVFFSVSIAYQIIFTKEKKIIYFFYVLFPVLLIFFCAALLNVSIIPYLKGGLNLISGHNEIMYLEENFDSELPFCLIVISLSTLTLLLKVSFKKNELLKTSLIFFLFFSSMYIIYKQGFIRADWQHISEFYRYILLIVFCFPDFHSRRNNLSSSTLLVGTVAAVFFFTPDKKTISLLNYKFIKTGYIEGFKQFNDTSGLRLTSTVNQLPQRIKDQVGNSSVDVYPWNSQLLIENKLNYKPRPVFQSYLAYTPYLEDLNFNFYNSAKAPAYVLYEYEAIDARYPLFDESKLNLVLLKNYSCVDTFSFSQRTVLLLKKINSASIHFIKTKEYKINFTDVITPEANTYYKLFISNSLSGKLISFAKHAPELNILINTKDGKQRQYRTSKSLLESGLFCNYTIDSTLGFYNVLKSDSLPIGDQITGYHLQAKNSSLFNDKITVIEYKLK